MQAAATGTGGGGGGQGSAAGLLAAGAGLAAAAFAAGWAAAQYAAGARRGGKAAASASAAAAASSAALAVAAAEQQARVDPAECVLLVCDVQERMGATPGFGRVVGATRALLRLCAALGVPAVATEQYPKGLGHTVPALLGEEIAHVYAKKSFSMLTPEVRHELRVGYPRARHVILAGLESHVCVFQTALDLAGEGYTVHLAVDAIASGDALGSSTALLRLARHPSVLPVTFEMVAFQMTGSAAHPAFRQVSRLVKERRAEVAAEAEAEAAHDATGA